MLTLPTLPPPGTVVVAAAADWLDSYCVAAAFPASRASTNASDLDLRFEGDMNGFSKSVDGGTPKKSTIGATPCKKSRDVTSEPR
jgi:hypothetical protein